MNLIVATRQEGTHLRFDVDGRWRYGDALSLAYRVKAGAHRTKLTRLLLDLRRVTPTGDAAPGRFLICDRLQRALAGPARVALLCEPELVDACAEAHGDGRAMQVERFDAEGSAVQWLATD